MSATATAAWPLDDLVAKLDRAGWGDDLSNRKGQSLRQVLHTLAAMLPHGSAEGAITLGQIADGASVCTKVASRSMARLVDLGLIQWRRGGIKAGRARPGWVRVSKRALSTLICHLEGYLRPRRKARVQARTERVERYKLFNAWPRKRNPLSFHTELKSPLPFLKGVNTAGHPAPPPSETGHTDMKQPCIHGSPDINGCGMCRRALRMNPSMDVRTLWAPKDAAKGDARRGRALCRAAVNASRQDTLT